MFVKCTTHVIWYYLDILQSLVCIYTQTYPHTHTHTQMQTCACAYMAQAQTKDLRYKSIWQSINTIIEYFIMIQCFISIEMVICMLQKIAAHDLTFLQYCIGNNVCIFCTIIIVCFSDSQVLGDLLMNTSGNDEYQEHGLFSNVCYV